MARFARKFRGGRNRKSRRTSSRGRGGLSGGTVKWNVNVEFPTDQFVKAIDKMEATVLFTTGRYMQRVYKTQLRRPPPKELTKTGRTTRRYMREVIGGVERPPYKQTGGFYNSIRFVVDRGRGATLAGPMQIDGKHKNIITPIAFPKLLDQGGKVIIRTRDKKKRNKHRQTVQYRSFPFKMTVYNKTRAFMLKKIKDVGLRP